MKKIVGSLLLVFACHLVFLPPSAYAQEKVIIDEVVAVIGNSAILKSDIINQQRQLEAQGANLGPNPTCSMLDDILYQKLLFNQAKIDSIEVSDDHVEQVLERRLRFFIAQIGSRERLEAYYGKSLEELKEEFRELVREQELSQRMESTITQNVSVTPAEVRRFFNTIHPDSIPMVESEMVLAKITNTPAVREEEKDLVKARLEEFRERILRGESFSTLAILYSEDPGSARRGGELGFVGRGELYPEFEANAFGLRPGELSEIVETEAGYHIIQMIERRGEQVNVRHILLRPKVSPEDLQQARVKLDSVRTLIASGEMTFAEAARKFSDHPGRINEGVMVNPYTGTSRFRSDELGQIDPNLVFIVDRLEVGQVSEPHIMMTEDSQQAYRLVTVISRVDPHRANLEEDYDLIQQLALQQKELGVIRQWINRRLGSTYVRINEEYRDCAFEHNWLKTTP
jgi:peptidyl-prolyl cis-trans isomerase SurA